ncbi:MAG: MATE family efflux transporter [Candidatus Cryptobacteroides sp.]|nr:MATE family efflux transporter [Candidatus Cryptobacteroides sp.]
MDSRYSYGRIWKIAYPILISLVMEQMIGMTDTAFLGRVGEIEIGASALAGVYYMVIFMLGLGFSIGVQIIIGRRNGEGHYLQAGEVFWHGLYFLLALAVVITAASEWLSPKIMGLIISSNNIYNASLSYIRWRVMGLIFGFSTAMFRAFYIGTTQTKALSINSLVMLLSNVLFNWALIFGKFGFPALGIAGAAIGSTLAELVSLIFFIVYTSKRCDTEKYALNKPSRVSWDTMRSIFSVSGWTMIQNFLSISTWFIFFLFIEHTGERALAVSNIIRNISGLIWMVLMAFASTCSTLVSNAIGEGRNDLVLPIVGKLLKISYILIIPLLLLFSLFPEYVIRIYTNIPDLIVDTVPSLWVLCASYLLTVPAFMFFQATSGTGNTKSAFALEGTALVIYVIYCAIIIGWLKLDVAVCWSAEAVYGGTMALVCGLYLKSCRWLGRAL